MTKAGEEMSGSGRKLYPSLSFVEISLYTGTWICGVMYAVLSLYQAGVHHLRRDNLRYGLERARPWWPASTTGHNMVTMVRDVSDHEWDTWKTVASQVYIYLFLYPILSWCVKKFFRQYSVHFCAIYSIMVTTLLLGIYPILYIFLLIVVMFVTYLMNSALLVWAVSISYILLLNTWPLQDIKHSMFPDHGSQMFEGYLTSIILAWINARCVSFCLDRIWGRVDREQSLVSGFIMLSAFCFYLPLGIMGPLVTSKKFKDSFSREPPPLSFKLISDAFLGVFRYSVWMLVTELSTYFFYEQALTHHPHLVRTLSLWALCGLGYALGQFFHLKYVVMYGVSGHFARIDGVEAPGHPACIARIHLYSDMWRYFDAGLYEFMRDYIYLPVITTLPATLFFKLLGSAICFSFVYVWHGTLDFVLKWSILNFLGITLESGAKTFAATQTYQMFEEKLSGQMSRRLHALLAAPLMVMSSLSNFYFFAGTEVGDIFVQKIIFESWPIGMPTLLGFLYCCCQTSIEVKNYKLKWQSLYGRDRRD